MVNSHVHTFQRCVSESALVGPQDALEVIHIKLAWQLRLNRDIRFTTQRAKGGVAQELVELRVLHVEGEEAT